MRSIYFLIRREGIARAWIDVYGINIKTNSIYLSMKKLPMSLASFDLS